MKFDLSEFGQMIKNHRGITGVRAAAKEIGISPATLSRIENGNMPDLEKFVLICKWLGQNPANFLGDIQSASTSSASVHFRKKSTTHVDTANALGGLIIAAQQALRDRETL